MSVPTAGRTHLAFVGATGMVGGYALRYALEHPAVERVTAIGRRTLGISHTKLNEKLTLRLSIGNIRTTERHVRQVWELLNEQLRLCSSRQE